MKKLVVLLLFVALIVVGYSIKSQLPVKAACSGNRNVGAGAAVGFNQVGNNNIDQVSQMNGGCGGSMVVRVDNGNVGDTQRAAQLAAYASSKGVTLIFQAVDPITGPAAKNLMQAVVSSSNGVKPVLIYGNELNDNKQNDGFNNISPKDYLNLLRQVQISLSGDLSSKMLLSMGTFNISNPGIPGSSINTDLYIKTMCQDANLCRQVMGNLQVYSTSSYPIGTICGTEGLVSYQCDQSIFAKYGVNIANLPVIITETGLQNNGDWFKAGYGHNQQEFLAYALLYFSQHPAEVSRIYAWNIFNALGLNNDWSFFNLFPGGQISPEAQKLLLALKAGAVVTIKDGKIVVDTSGFDECKDENGVLIGYVTKGDTQACDDLLSIFKNVRQNQRHPEDVCTASNISPSVFRPRPCENCDRELPGSTLTGSNATTVEVFANFRIPWAEVLASPTCGGSRYVTRSWEGTLQINTDDTLVPFAGWGKSDTLASDAAMVNYLADYYDGTAFYDQKAIDLTGKTDSEKADLVNDVLAKGGVFRKLTPDVVQDDMRRKFIKRVQDQTGALPPGNYDIKLGDEKVKVSDFYFGLDASGLPTNKHVKPMRRDYPVGPDGTNQFSDAFVAWQKLSGGSKNEPGFWEKMWYAIPMVSREDAPGTLNLSIQGPPGDIQQPNGKPAEYQVAFPHLARLFEISNLVQQYFKNLLNGASNNFLNSPDIASSFGINQLASTNVGDKDKNYNSKVLGENSCPLQVKIQPNIQRQPNGGVKVCWNIKGNSLKQTEGGQGCDWTYKVFVNGKGVAERYLTGGNCIYKPAEKAGGTNYPGCSDTILPGNVGSVNISMQVGSFGKNDDISSCNNADVSAAITCAVGPDGQVTGANCIPTEATTAPPAPVCGNNFFYTPYDVDDPNALSDTINNKNLDVVCTNPYPVTAKVIVKDDQIEVPAGTTPEEDDNGRQYIIVRTSRKIGVGATIPFLDQIWEQVKWISQSMAPNTNAQAMNNGNFQAKSPVKYNFSLDSQSGLLGGGVTPGDGDLYFPNLGGSACAKIYQIKSSIPSDKFAGTSIAGFFDQNCKDFFKKMGE